MCTSTLTAWYTQQKGILNERKKKERKKERKKEWKKEIKFGNIAEKKQKKEVKET